VTDVGLCLEFLGARRGNTKCRSFRDYIDAVLNDTLDDEEESARDIDPHAMPTPDVSAVEICEMLLTHRLSGIDRTRVETDFPILNSTGTARHSRTNRGLLIASLAKGRIAHK